MTAPPLTIDVQQLRVTRQGNEILHDLSFQARAGELVGLLGPSGSGKSTLMRSMLGLQRVASGQIQVLDTAAGSPSLRGRLGYMAQGGAVYLDLTVEENVRYFAGVLALSHEEVDRVLGVVSLAGFTQRVVASLSGGERARVSLATALLGSPPILILDEPTVGLDPILRRDLWHTFEQIASTGTTVLVSSHVMDEATHCERLLLLRGGELIFDASPARLLASTSASSYDDAFEQLIEEGP
ncbi:MAG: ABC transporter ATP-binding protein [Acidimicrobiales bacterium]